MIMQGTAERLRRSGPVPVLAAALLLAAGTVWAARDQDSRSPADDSSAGERVEAPRAEPQESPSEPAPEPPAESPSEPSDNTAVPTVPDAGRGPNRQPPTQHRGGGVTDGGDDGYIASGDTSVDEDDDSGYNLPSPYRSSPSHGIAGSSRAGMGALDLDIKPSRAQVFLDGQPIGKADAFDGWPRYLWLPEGTYDLVFYLDGYQTIGRRMTVHRALVVDMDDHLRPGPSIRPEDFQPEPRQ